MKAVPAAAVYRKYSSVNGWSAFVEDAKNRIYSTKGAEGVCPSPGNKSYQRGLRAGHHCVQLMIEDGGPNDADNRKNGTIVDPGGVDTAPKPAPVSSSSSAGGSMSLILLFMLLGLFGTKICVACNKLTLFRYQKTRPERGLLKYNTKV